MESSNYKLLRIVGKVITVLFAVLILIATYAYISTLIVGGGIVRPIEPIWLLFPIGLAFGQICRAIADIADNIGQNG